MDHRMTPLVAEPDLHVAMATSSCPTGPNHPAPVLDLDSATRRRCDHLPAERSREALAARTLGACALSAIDTDARKAHPLRQRCPACAGRDHGRPYVEGQPSLSVSWGHTHGWVAAAAGRTSVGVDLERVSAFRAPDGAAPIDLSWTRQRSGPERHPMGLARLWTRVESLVKAGAFDLDTGLGLLDAGAVPMATEQWQGWRLGTAVVDAPDPIVVSWASEQAAGLGRRLR